ncbi:MAG: aldo/keto reductase [Myxococcales bacterium]|nr:aldo/keto reductase [Myxococcales bacterium]
MGTSDPGSRLDRREFLRRGALTGVGLGLLPLSPARSETEAEPPGVRRRVRLGRTGLELPDIGFGGSRLQGDEDLVRYALDRGITHFDTAETYTGGASEATIGRALKGVRDRVTIASKVKAGAIDSQARLMTALEGSLRRLRTDRIDLYFNHAVNDVERLQNPEWPEFVHRARQQGKIRFAGLSGHGGRLVECLDHALDHDQIDVMLVAYNFGQDPRFFEKLTRSLDFVARQPDLPRVMARAKQKGVGVIAMKTLRGGRLNDMRPYESGGATFSQAAFRWVLGGPNVDALVVTMKSRAMIDEYLGASGWDGPRRADWPLLGRYEEIAAATQCRYGCGDCADACPRGVPIADVLRSRMYARDYRDPDLARDEYALLGAGAAPCLECADRPCDRACPHGLDIPRLTTDAHGVLARRLA